MIKTTDEDLEKMTQKDWDDIKEVENIKQKLHSLLDTVETGDLQLIHKHYETDFLPAIKKHNTDRNIKQEVDEWVENASGVFFSTDIDKDLNIPDKKYRSKLLKKLEEDGVIESCKERQGKWRKVDNLRLQMKWWESSGDEVPLKLPLGVHEQVMIFPHTMIAVAGLWSAGKSAYCMNTATMNYNIFGDTIDYILCAEMGPNRFKRRLMSGGVNLEDFKKHVEVFEYIGGSLPDLIRPNKLTIIDYLVPQDEGLWKVNTILKDINDRIDDGIVMVAMQKPGGRDTAFGGDFSAMVPSVYLAINDGLAKIVKAKEFDEEKVSNPAGKIISFQLRSGFHFDTTDLWHRKEDEEALTKYPKKY